MYLYRCRDCIVLEKLQKKTSIKLDFLFFKEKVGNFVAETKALNKKKTTKIFIKNNNYPLTDTF